MSYIPVQRMDMERATREAMDPNLRHKPRLLAEEELPSWLIKDEDEVRNRINFSKSSITKCMCGQSRHCHKYLQIQLQRLIQEKFVNV